MDTALTAAITATHNHIQTWSEMDGNIIMHEHIKKTKSARLSILSPRLLTAFIFLAMDPSIISENPHQQYNAQKAVLNAGTNRMTIAVTPLDAEIMFGRFLT